VEKKPIIVFCTTPDLDCAKRIAHFLIEQKLAACCNILPAVLSVYAWQDNIQQDSEQLLVIKSTKDIFQRLQDAIVNQHPYDVPEIISMDITAGSKKYLDWISENVR
jgi:periplasmic divalent cation tolerance protein